MTREEQIKKQADIYTDDASNYAEWSEDGGWSETNDIELVEKAFIEGAKWADKTMIDKVCELLAEIVIEVTYKDLNGDVSVEHYDKMEFIEDFRKAMEE